MGEDDLPSGQSEPFRGIAPPPSVHVRCQKNIKLQSGKKPRISFETGIQEKARKMGISDHFLLETVAAIGVLGIDGESQGVVVEVRNSGDQIPSFLVKKGPVGNEKLEIPDLGPVHGRIVNLVDDPVGQGIPEVARRIVSRADSILAA
jgi:hypothetical protein